MLDSWLVSSEHYGSVGTTPAYHRGGAYLIGMMMLQRVIAAVLRAQRKDLANALAGQTVRIRKRRGKQSDAPYVPDVVFEVDTTMDDLPNHWSFHWYLDDPEDDEGVRGLWVDLGRVGEWHFPDISEQKAEKLVRGIAEDLVEELEAAGWDVEDVDKHGIRGWMKRLGGRS